MVSCRLNLYTNINPVKHVLWYLSDYNYSYHYNINFYVSLPHNNIHWQDVPISIELWLKMRHLGAWQVPRSTATDLSGQQFCLLKMLERNVSRHVPQHKAYMTSSFKQKQGWGARKAVSSQGNPYFYDWGLSNMYINDNCFFHSKSWPSNKAQRKDISSANGSFFNFFLLSANVKIGYKHWLWWETRCHDMPSSLHHFPEFAQISLPYCLPIPTNTALLQASFVLFSIPYFTILIHL